MNSALLNLLNPLEPRHADALGQMARAAAALQVDFVIVGGLARDIHFEHVWGIFTRRRTFDLDMAVHLTDWSHYERFRQGLEERAHFRSVQGAPETLLAEGGAILNIIPYGGVAVDGRIAWPEANRWMSVTGLADVYRHSMRIEISCAEGPTVVRVASLPGLVLLKLIALSDNVSRVQKDTNDIEFIIEHYLAAGNRSRLEQGPDAGLMQSEPLDLTLASARLLGRDMARISSPETLVRLVEILRREVSDDARGAMAAELGLLMRGDFKRARAILAELLEGYTEG